MHILAIDAGTTSVRALVYKDGCVVGRASKELGQHFPQPGWVEHDPNEILALSLTMAKAACKVAKIKPAALGGVGITNQRETVVVWDDAGPIYPAIVWQDRRTAKRCKAVQIHANTIRAKTGLILDAYFSATKIEWILDHIPGARERALAGELKAGTIDAWLAWSLTGQHVTDPTNASRTMLWDIHRSCWDEDLLELFNIPQSMLPRVVPSSHVIGIIPAFGSAPLSGLVGDQQAALLGQGCVEPGQAKNTYGTGCFLLQHTGTQAKTSRNGLLTTRAASFDTTPQFALEGSVFIGGAAIQWLRDGLKIIDDAPGVNGRAAETESSQGVVVVPAFAGLGAPHWDAETQGAILGISRGTSRRHIAYATLESIALQCRDLIQAMQKDTGLTLTELRVDGGATASSLLMQVQANLLGIPILRNNDSDATARGAAMLAASAVGATWSAGPEFDVVKPQGKAPRELIKRWNAALQAVQAFKP